MSDKLVVSFGDGVGNDSPLFHGVAPNAQSVLARFTWVNDLELAGLATSNSAIAFGANYDGGATGGHTFAHCRDSLPIRRVANASFSRPLDGQTPALENYFLRLAA